MRGERSALVRQSSPDLEGISAPDFTFLLVLASLPSPKAIQKYWRRPCYKIMLWLGLILICSSVAPAASRLHLSLLRKRGMFHALVVK